jgi:hypothetical protein
MLIYLSPKISGWIRTQMAASQRRKSKRSVREEKKEERSVTIYAQYKKKRH